MNQSAYQIILKEIAPLLTEKGYQEQGEEYVSDTKAVSVVYDEARQLFELRSCEVSDGKPDGEWKTLSSWLFDEGSTDKDARSIGRDFCDSLTGMLGAKPAASRSKVAMPDKTAGGDTPNLEALAQRFLTLVPQYKETYREHVEANGACRYVEFFEATAVPHIRGLLQENNKKQLEKMMDMLDEIYCSGTKEATAMVSVVFLGESIGGDPELLRTALSYMEDHKYLAVAVEHIFRKAKKPAAAAQ